VDPVLFDARGSGADIRRTLGIPGDAVVAGFVGWFDVWDRLELLIDAAGALKATCPQLRVVLVGDGPVARDLRARVHAGGLGDIVVFAGAVARAQVPAYIDAMDIGVLAASNAFGSPLALFELMGMGKAVVAPDIGPVRDVMEDSVTGTLVTVGDGAALTAALARLLKDPVWRRSLGEKARARVLERHTWAANGRFVADLAARLSAGAPC
jgi:glycosyltransferase involved in cell wall biosynthesis